MRRRDFLIETSRAVLGGSFLASTARAQGTPIPAAASKIDHAAMIAELERLIPPLLRDSKVPGASIAVIDDARLVWRRGFGVKDSASQEPVDHDTVFEAASVSKTVFAYAVLKLCEQGILDLDTPLTKYAPTRFLAGDARLDLITARHVLSHTTGFQDWRSGGAPLKIHFTPGTQFSYSGEGYYYLQSVVTHLIGRTDPAHRAKYEAGLEVVATDIDACLNRRLLRPFGMAASGYLWNESFARHVTRPHDLAGNPLAKARPSATDAARYASAGGLHTTATDYARFLLEILDPKPSDEFRLNQRSLAEMVRPQVKLDEQQKIDGANAWALGWAVQQRATGNVIVHSGGQSGFRSLAMASVDRRSGFIILTNGDNGGNVVYDQALGAVLNRLLPS
ncbi:MAG: beta-lactamase family protein [Opitutaceae bacterium]|nr:beta-lactamase family protein [Opitutaceae bacterium]